MIKKNEQQQSSVDFLMQYLDELTDKFTQQDYETIKTIAKSDKYTEGMKVAFLKAAYKLMPKDFKFRMLFNDCLDLSNEDIQRFYLNLFTQSMGEKLQDSKQQLDKIFSSEVFSNNTKKDFLISILDAEIEKKDTVSGSVIKFSDQYVLLLKVICNFNETEQVEILQHYYEDRDIIQQILPLLFEKAKQIYLRNVFNKSRYWGIKEYILSLDILTYSDIEDEKIILNKYFENISYEVSHMIWSYGKNASLANVVNIIIKQTKISNNTKAEYLLKTYSHEKCTPKIQFEILEYVYLFDKEQQRELLNKLQSSTVIGNEYNYSSDEPIHYYKVKQLISSKEIDKELLPDFILAVFIKSTPLGKFQLLNDFAVSIENDHIKKMLLKYINEVKTIDSFYEYAYIKKMLSIDVIRRSANEFMVHFFNKCNETLRINFLLIDNFPSQMGRESQKNILFSYLNYITQIDNNYKYRNIRLIGKSYWIYNEVKAALMKAAFDISTEEYRIRILADFYYQTSENLYNDLLILLLDIDKKRDVIEIFRKETNIPEICKYATIIEGRGGRTEWNAQNQEKQNFLPEGFYIVSNFINDIAIIKKKDSYEYKYGCINSEGIFILPPEFYDFVWIWERKGENSILVTRDFIFDNEGSIISKLNIKWNKDNKFEALSNSCLLINNKHLIDDKGEKLINIIDGEKLITLGSFILKITESPYGSYSRSVYDMNGTHLYNIIDSSGKYRNNTFTLSENDKLFIVRQIIYEVDEKVLYEKKMRGNIGIVQYNEKYIRKEWIQKSGNIPFLYEKKSDEFNVILPFEYDKYVPIEYNSETKGKLHIFKKADNGKYGAISIDCNSYNIKYYNVIPFEFDKIICYWEDKESSEKTLFLVAKDEKKGVYNGHGEEIVPVIYPKFLRCNDSYMSIVVNDSELKGLFSKPLGQMIIPVMYNKIITEIYSKFYIVENIEGCWGLYKENEEVLPCIYQKIIPLKNINGCIALIMNNKYGLFSQYDGLILKCEYDNILPSRNGTFRIFKNGKCGLISEKGEILIKMKYDSIIDFEGSKLYAVQNNNIWSFLDKKSLVKITDQQYDKVTAYVNNCYIAKKDDEWILIDEGGIEVEKGVVSIRVEERYGDITCYKIDSTGKLIKENSYNYADDYNDYERDTFDALTDGQLGDYDDFKNDDREMDSLTDSLGY